MVSFDPYLNWLGIPPHEQPPNFYRLLGVVLFESNPEVIVQAADRQSLRVGGYQAGPQAVWRAAPPAEPPGLRQPPSRSETAQPPASRPEPRGAAWPAQNPVAPTSWSAASASPAGATASTSQPVPPWPRRRALGPGHPADTHLWVRVAAVEDWACPWDPVWDPACPGQDRLGPCPPVEQIAGAVSQTAGAGD